MEIAAARMYEEYFVPALFGPFADPVAEAAELEAGNCVLDVGCGTGVLTRAVAERVGPQGSVTGLDPSPGMLTIAARHGGGIHWCRGMAETLPFATGVFDRVVSQFGLNFFADRIASLHEMARVTKPGGQLTVAVWSGLERSPGYAALIDLLGQLFGEPIGDALREPFALGNPPELRRLFFEVDLSNVEIATLKGEARFPSIRSWVFSDLQGWSPVGGALNDEQIEALCKTAESELAEFVLDDGVVAFPIAANIATTTRE